MKVKVLLVALVLTGFWSCQQNEVLEDQSNQQVMNFTSVIAGDNAMTRAGSTSIDIVSLCTNKKQVFSEFNIKTDFCFWSELGTKNVNFYAHYPKLPENESFGEGRLLQGGIDYMFGTAKAVFGQQSVCLEFKRMTAPVYIEILDVDGKVLEGKSVKLNAVNRGYQNLHTGSITVPVDMEKEKVTVKRLSGEPIHTNLLPQKMEKGTRFEVELASGQTYAATLSQDAQLNSGESYKMTIQGNKVVVSIFDGCIPL